MLSSTRRKLLAASGGALAVSGILGSVGTAATTESDEPDVESEDGWPSSRGAPNNNAYFPDRSGPEAPVAVDWERDRGGPIAVRDGTVYQTTDEEVHALDAEDGSTLWESDAVGASGTPAIDSGSLYVGGDSLTALDADDGTVRWQADLEDGEELTPPNVSDGDAYTLSETALYAFDSDGSKRWSFEAEEEFYTNGAPPVADGAVFACSESYVFARDLEDGTERWTTEIPDEMVGIVGHDPIVAGQGYVAVAMDDGEGPYPSDVVLYDTETGEEGERYEGNVPATITEDRVYTNPTYDAAGFDRETGGQVWEPDQPVKQAQQPVVGEDGIYVGIDGTQEDPDEEDEHGLFVFDEDGAVKWSVVPDDENGVPRLDATLVEGTVYGRGGDRLLAIRSEAELEDREDDDEKDGEEGEEEDEPEEESESDEDDDGAEEPDEEADDGEEDEEEAEGEGTEDDASDDSPTDETDDASDDGTGDDDADDDDDDDGDPEAEDDAEGTPGFTTGAGIAGGVLGLEWLRRRASPEERQD
ncbi:pyrrolo-quinoline quinone beta-propeller repeat protein [Natronococcus amylolyticus DSM 10524]|uniref:Pyrrolo-quinoline quinone beta-propeller repeat protein n=1 Tax=Natronococcus amylolyticus DSM 10524 TaxID=1227497 RepID=L9X113_9EURY|nr:PQQ-binding-like beta-propeller repeat protein [Natronococcus amylolyticus]ELY55410.1 pyrrolo-quinoline quinone beta-propeller repeat protein [Natronococcus amylolyticus DSM 10524]